MLKSLNDLHHSGHSGSFYIFEPIFISAHFHNARQARQVFRICECCRRAAPPVPAPPLPRGLVTAAKVANVSSQRDPQVAPLPNAAAQKCKKNS